MFTFKRFVAGCFAKDLFHLSEWVVWQSLGGYSHTLLLMTFLQWSCSSLWGLQKSMSQTPTKKGIYFTVSAFLMNANTPAIAPADYLATRRLII